MKLATPRRSANQSKGLTPESSAKTVSSPTMAELAADGSGEDDA